MLLQHDPACLVWGRRADWLAGHTPHRHPSVLAFGAVSLERKGRESRDETGRAPATKCCCWRRMLAWEHVHLTTQAARGMRTQ